MIDQKQILARMRTAFQAEATDLLNELDSALLQLETDPANPELINRVFRAIHTIKGSGATAGFERLSRFAHRVEEVFNAARDGKVAITPEIMDFALRGCDLLRAFLIDADQTPALQADVENEIVTRLAKFIGRVDSPATNSAGVTAAAPVGLRRFHIRFKPAPEIFLSGTDPTSLLEELSNLGTAYVTPDLECMPGFLDLVPEHCYIGWDIDIETNAPVERLREVFLFVSGECELDITPVDGEASSSSRVGGRQFDLFYCEAEEHLDGSEEHLLRIEKHSSDDDWAALFRHLHSLKGACALLQGEAGELPQRHPLRMLHGMAHASESLIESERAVSFINGAEVCNTLLEVVGAMRSLLRALDTGAGVEISPYLLQRLKVPLPDERSAANPPVDPKQAALEETARQCAEAMQANLVAAITQPESGAHETYTRALQTLSNTCVYAGAESLQSRLRGHALVYEKARNRGGDDERAREIVANDLREIISLFSQGSHQGRRSTPSSMPPPAAEGFRMRSTDSGAQTIRVDQEKLDRLFRNVSELLVARGSLPLLARRLDRDFALTEISRDVKDSGNTISRIAEELQNTVMSLRMVPIRTVFQRFPRLVRDLARSLDKEIEVIMEGDDTELDRTVMQEIGDPLVHLVRNAADHGIEPAEMRAQCGKPRCGRIVLRAYNQASNAVIEVEDDGKGLFPDVLKAKAVEKGMISPAEAEAMGEEAAFSLIFKPGFSTAATVSDVSGRGVGMDVVCSNVQKLKGTVSIKSQPRTGTKFTITLPASLMISKGILVECCGEQFMLPVESIAEIRKVECDQLRSYGDKRLVSTPAGTLPVVSLGKALDLAGENRSNAEQSLAIVTADGRHYGLLVDRFLSEEQVVVKPLTGGLERKEEFLGATIMGDGRIVLMVNPKQILTANSSVTG